MQPAADQIPAPGTPPRVRLINRRALRCARPACCCTGRRSSHCHTPVRGWAHQTDVLLCGHHYRATRQALAAAGASVVDMTGVPIAGYEWPKALTDG